MVLLLCYVAVPVFIDVLHLRMLGWCAHPRSFMDIGHRDTRKRNQAFFFLLLVPGIPRRLVHPALLVLAKQMTLSHSVALSCPAIEHRQQNHLLTTKKKGSKADGPQFKKKKKQKNNHVCHRLLRQCYRVGAHRFS